MQSIVDYLKSLNKPSDFESRKKMFESKYGGRYTGSAQQNIFLLKNMLAANSKPQLDNLGGGESCQGLSCGLGKLGQLSPFNLHPANMMMKQMLGFNNTMLPPPMNAMTSMMGKMMPSVTGPGSDGPVEPVAALENLLPMLPFMKMGSAARAASAAASPTTIKANPARSLFHAVGDRSNPYLQPASPSMELMTNRTLGPQAEDALAIIDRIRKMSGE